MKKLSVQRNLSLIAMLILLQMFSVNLFGQTNKTPDGVGDNYVFAMTGDTTYQVMGMHTDGSVMLIRIRNNSNLVEKIAFRKTDTSAMFLMYFDSDGNPSVASYRKQIYLFGNYKAQKADIIVCNTDGTNKEIKGVDAVFPKPLFEIKPGNSKTSGPARGNFTIDPATLANCIGYASTGLGIVSCAVTVYTAGAFAMPCISALIDVASRIIPEKYEKTKFVLVTANDLLGASGSNFNNIKGLLNSFSSMFKGASMEAEAIDGWIKLSAQKTRISVAKEQYYSASFLTNNSGNSEAKANINMGDFNTIISLYEECEAKTATLKKKKETLAATLTQTNYETVGPQVEKIVNDMDALKKEYETKINAIAAKKTITYGFSKADKLPYTISRIVISGAKWNSALYLNYVINFTASPMTEVDKNFDPPKTYEIVMREMWFDIMGKSNDKITSEILSINKLMRSEGVVKGAIKIDFFRKADNFLFNSKEYKIEYGY
jgi:hypothetical protein